MSDNEQVDTSKTKWLWKRKCACGECRFYSWEERPECPAMRADPSLIGEKLWYMDVSMIGMKDYIDPLDSVQPQAYNEKSKPANEEKVDEQKEV